MSRMLPYYKMYPADAETDENFKAMTDEELGFYWRCLNHCWINGSLPADSAERARVMGRTKKVSDRLWDRVGRCFVEMESDTLRIVNRRQEQERDKAISKSESATKSVRTRYDTATNVGTNVEETNLFRKKNEAVRALARAESGSEFGYTSEIESRKPFELTSEEFDAAWERHKNYSRVHQEPKQVVLQKIMSMNGKFNIEIFRARHGPWCEYWGKKGWNAYGSVTFLGWIDAGMPLPPEDKQDRDSKLDKAFLGE